MLQVKELRAFYMRLIEISSGIKKGGIGLLLHVMWLICIFVVVLVVLVIIVLVPSVVCLGLIILVFYFISVQAQRTIQNFKAYFFCFDVLIRPKVIYDFNRLLSVYET